MEFSRAEINRMGRDQLRSLVQRLMQVDDWPGDWQIAGEILENYYFNFQRSKSGAQLFGITLFGDLVTGSGIDDDAVVAIFRAYISMRLEESDLRRNM